MEIARTVKIKNEEATKKFGIKLAKELVPGDVIALIGDLGTGKTALTGYIAEGLGIKKKVNSPTFNIVKEYHDGRMPLFHFDVYRIHDPGEMFNIGAEEYFYGGGVCIIEWADLIEDVLPENTKYIFIEYGKKEGERVYQCTF